ncbi:MAG: DNA recombination/repair protein RecA, partial [Robiginitomaculum sp.]
MAKKRPELTVVGKAPDSKKAAALEAALSQIDRAYGKGSVMKLGQKQDMDVEAISTGSIGLDIALGIGGLPAGRVVEIYGPESSGKTTLALHVIAEAQKAGGVAAFVDAEHALDPIYAAKLGVDVNELLISQPDTGEQALEITDTLVRSGAISVLVIDSVAALTPRAELEGEMGDHHVGLQARLMSQALKGEPLTVYGDGTQQRCFCDVGDIVQGVVGLTENERAHGKVFNMGGTEEVSIRELAERIVRIADSSSEIKIVPYEEAYP